MFLFFGNVSSKRTRALSGVHSRSLNHGKELYLAIDDPVVKHSMSKEPTVGIIE